MKKLLIISPYFPPFNTPDMQRIRMSLPYFNQFGWEADVVTVDERYADMPTDDLLLSSIPANIKVYKVKALNKKWTSKLGLGSIALRSLPYFNRRVNQLLKTHRYDLIYFSTTQFPVCILGAYWKKRFGVPYVIDMQDPWHSDYYQNKSKADRPAKYWFSYRLNKYLEPIAMNKVGGLISVSQAYITDLTSRYPVIKNIPAKTITFGAFANDLQIALDNADRYPNLLSPDTVNLVYIGRGGTDMHRAIDPIFTALQKARHDGSDVIKKLKLYFIGTSYAPSGQGVPTILPLTSQYGIQDLVMEITDRISYYHALQTMQQADALLITGSDDPKYSASKIYPYLLTKKPVLALFNSQSPVRDILTEYGLFYNLSYSDTDSLDKVEDFLKKLVGDSLPEPVYDTGAVEKYSALNMTKQQCELFDRVVK